MSVVNESRRAPSGSHARLASASAGQVLQHIRSRRATTNAELVEVTGLSRATLAQRLEQLMRHQLVIIEPAPSTGGRPPRRFAFNPGAGVILGADLGATHGTIAVADLAGVRIASRAVELPIADGPEPVLTEVLAPFDSPPAAGGHDRAAVGARGLGAPGPVAFTGGRPVRPPIMPGWDDFDIRGWFAGRLPGPVLVDNDVN